MNVKILNYDKVSKEADIEFSNNRYSLTAYCSFLKDELIEDEYNLFAFLPKDIRKVEEIANVIKTNDGFYSYKVTGKLVCRENDYCTIMVDELKIRLEEVPLDIMINDYVSFITLRIDYCEI